METDVALKFYSNQHEKKLNEFELPSEQEKFTSLPSAMGEVQKGQYRIVILQDNEPVGFFLLHATKRVQEYTDNPHAMLLTALSIDYKQQGKGIAKKSMNQLPAFVREEFPGCDQVVLAVNHRNIAAQMVYKRVGFTDSERRIEGPIGEQYVYVKNI
ncbi:hypothetical protein JCM19037_2370 [Geomicrobium sp. JCM 19037]|uniref:GNAT family N-acetyltransferase n=1 Tax=unclassified Geomicrobium TaxID=2628951 RepID=UPI00045F1B95|nr:GNAT family protein [Geomicrobium sp. JCM 19037]GAK03999.1 hypothetical protein JCM19037_2370 [Geomicrobium sp. JCM 19037]